MRRTACGAIVPDELSVVGLRRHPHRGPHGAGADDPADADRGDRRRERRARRSRWRGIRAPPRTPRRTVFEPTLVVRESTAPPSVRASTPAGDDRLTVDRPVTPSRASPASPALADEARGIQTRIASTVRLAQARYGMAPTSTGPSPRRRRRHGKTDDVAAEVRASDSGPAVPRGRSRPPRARCRPAGRPSRGSTRAARARGPRTRGSRRRAGRARHAGRHVQLSTSVSPAPPARPVVGPRGRRPRPARRRQPDHWIARRSAPRRDPDRQGPGRRRRLEDRHRDRAVPWVVGLDREAHRRTADRRRGARRSRTGGPGRPLSSVGRQVLLPRAQQAHQVRRAAGARNHGARPPSLGSTATRSVRRWSGLT